MDWLQPVLSEEGRKLNASEQTPAAAVLDLANRVAAGLENSFPEERHQVHVLLPPELRKPPATLRAHPNVVVHLSNRDCDFSKPLSDFGSVANKAFAKDLAGWRRAKARVYVLDHVTNMREPRLPFPNLSVIASNIIWYADQNVEGIYVLCGPAESPEQVDLAALRSYLVSCMLWDPDSPAEEHLQDFLKAYYGPAASHIREYLDTLESAQRRSGIPLTVIDRCDWLDADTLRALENILERAEVPHLQEIQLERIHRLRAALAQVGELLGRIPPSPINEESADG